MRGRLRGRLILLAGIVLPTLVAQSAAAQPRINDVEFARALRGGGHTIVMRHAPADPNKGDTDPLNFKNIRAQRPLTEAGKAAAKAFGDAIRAIGIPIGEVISSRFNRCYQTAVIAGFKNDDIKAVTDVTDGSQVASPNENRRRGAQLRQLTAGSLPLSQNRLIVTHKNNIMQAFGKEWFDVREGEASVFRVDKGAYTLIARLQLDEWARIARSVQN
jgi:phosphohistidine phosphatase SixA